MLWGLISAKGTVRLNPWQKYTLHVEIHKTLRERALGQGALTNFTGCAFS